MSNALQKLIDQVKTLPIWNQLKGSDSLDEIGAGAGAVAGGLGGGLLGMIIAGRKKRLKGFGVGAAVGGGLGAAAGYGLGGDYMHDRDRSAAADIARKYSGFTNISDSKDQAIARTEAEAADDLANEQSIRDEEDRARNQEQIDSAARDEEDQVNDQFAAQAAKEKETSDAYAGYESQMKAATKAKEEEAYNSSGWMNDAASEEQMKQAQRARKKSDQDAQDVQDNAFKDEEDQVNAELDRTAAQGRQKTLDQAKEPKTSTLSQLLSAFANIEADNLAEGDQPGTAAPTKGEVNAGLTAKAAGKPAKGGIANAIKNLMTFRGVPGSEVPLEGDTMTSAPVNVPQANPTVTSSSQEEVDVANKKLASDAFAAIEAGRRQSTLDRARDPKASTLGQIPAVLAGRQADKLARGKQPELAAPTIGEQLQGWAELTNRLSKPLPKSETAKPSPFKGGAPAGTETEQERFARLMQSDVDKGSGNRRRLLKGRAVQQLLEARKLQVAVDKASQARHGRIGRREARSRLSDLSLSPDLLNVPDFGTQWGR